MIDLYSKITVEDMTITRTGILTGEVAMSFIPAAAHIYVYLLAAEIVTMPEHVLSQLFHVRETAVIISRTETGVAIYAPTDEPMLIDVIIAAGGKIGYAAYDGMWTGQGFRIDLESI